MTILDRHIAKKLLASMFKIMASLVLLFIIVDLVTHRQDNIVKYDIPAATVAHYYLTFVPVILIEYQAAALAMLLAGLTVLGKAAQDAEITAALAGGISLRRIARMPVLIALGLALGVFAFQETYGVKAIAVATRIEREYFTKFAGDARTGASWANLADREDPAAPRWTCHVNKFNRIARTGEEVYLYAVGEETLRVIEAHRIYWDPDQETWFLEDGLSAVFHPQRDMESEVRRITQTPAPFAETPDVLFALEEPPEAKSARELRSDLQRAASMGIPIQRPLVDYHAKFARPALCFVMIWLAIPVALRVRRGGIAIGFGISIGIALAYLLIFYASMGLGRWEMLHPALAAWFPNLAFLAGGLWMFWKTPT